MPRSLHAMPHVPIAVVKSAKPRGVMSQDSMDDVRRVGLLGNSPREEARHQGGGERLPVACAEALWRARGAVARRRTSGRTCEQTTDLVRRTAQARAEVDAEVSTSMSELWTRCGRGRNRGYDAAAGLSRSSARRRTLLRGEHCLDDRRPLGRIVHNSHISRLPLSQEMSGLLEL